VEYLHKYKRLFIIGLIAASLVLMAFTGRSNYEQGFIRSSIAFVITSGQALFANIGGWFSDRFDTIRSNNALQAENALLQAEVARLETELSRFHHLDEENAMLAEVLELHRHYANYNTLGANIISRNPGNWSESFTIDRGSRDGISINMAVLAPGGLAGRISLLGFNYAVVTPIIEDGAAVTAMGLRTNDTGVVTGDVNLASRGLLRMNHIELDAELGLGDMIVTSPLSAIFPPGIRIGYVTEIGQAAGGLRYAIISPAVDFSRLQTVLIITDTFGFELE